MHEPNSPHSPTVSVSTTSIVLSVGVLVLMTLAPVVLGIFSPWGCERFTDAFPIALERLRGCPLAVEALGDNPDKAWGVSNFHIGSNGETGRANFTTQVTGGKQRGEYQVFATRTFDTWTLQTATLLLPGERRILDVKACAEVPPSP